MTTAEPRNLIPPEDMAALQAAVDRLAKGTRNPAAMDAACEEMDRGRDEIRSRLGDLSVAVDLIRDARDNG